MNTDVPKLMLFLLFFPFIIVWYIGKFIFMLIADNAERRKEEHAAVAEFERHLPVQPQLLDMPTSSRNTLYGSKQPD
jgi:hypothetical protein